MSAPHVDALASRLAYFLQIAGPRPGSRREVLNAWSEAIDAHAERGSFYALSIQIQPKEGT